MKLRLSWRYFLQNQNALRHRRLQYYERTILKQRARRPSIMFLLRYGTFRGTFTRRRAYV
jgi:hypothetical protein